MYETIIYLDRTGNYCKGKVIIQRVEKEDWVAVWFLSHCWSGRHAKGTLECYSIMMEKEVTKVANLLEVLSYLLDINAYVKWNMNLYFYFNTIRLSGRNILEVTGVLLRSRFWNWRIKRPNFKHFPPKPQVTHKPVISFWCDETSVLYLKLQGQRGTRVLLIFSRKYKSRHMDLAEENQRILLTLVAKLYWALYNYKFFWN